MRVSTQSKKDFEKPEKSTFLLIFRAIFSINVNARVEENVKTKAEGILSAMGIPAGGDTAGFRFVLMPHNNSAVKCAIAHKMHLNRISAFAIMKA